MGGRRYFRVEFAQGDVSAYGRAWPLERAEVFEVSEFTKGAAVSFAARLCMTVAGFPPRRSLRVALAEHATVVELPPPPRPSKPRR